MPAAQGVARDLHAVPAVGPAQAHRLAPRHGRVQQRLGGGCDRAGVGRDAQGHLRILRAHVADIRVLRSMPCAASSPPHMIQIPPAAGRPVL